MSIPLVFKHRVISPQSKNRDSHIKNKAHISYIGKRAGVFCNENMYHGLFGKVWGKDFGNIENLKEVMDYVEKKR